MGMGSTPALPCGFWNIPQAGLAEILPLTQKIVRAKWAHGQKVFRGAWGLVAGRDSYKRRQQGREATLPGSATGSLRPDMGLGLLAPLVHPSGCHIVPAPSTAHPFTLQGRGQVHWHFLRK